MKHLFLPYQLSDIAKEKGFDEPCFGYYLTHGNNKLMPIIMLFDKFEPLRENDYLNAPLYQQIIDWFREKHKIDIFYYPSYENDDFSYTAVIKANNKYYRLKDDQLVEDNEVNDKEGYNYYDSHQECITEAIKEAFKLI